MLACNRLLRKPKTIIYLVIAITLLVTFNQYRNRHQIPIPSAHFSVVVVGVYEGMTGPFSWTNTFILVVHCYFNVCQRLQQGLRSFLQRRRAVKKSSNLPNATSDQLLHHKDVCAICFMDMMSVSASVVTPSICGPASIQLTLFSPSLRR